MLSLRGVRLGSQTTYAAQEVFWDLKSGDDEIQELRPKV
jgi:hypothetical protein